MPLQASSQHVQCWVSAAWANATETEAFLSGMQLDQATSQLAELAGLG